MGEPPASTGSAVGALIANVVGILLCWPFGLIGTVVSIIGLATANSNPRASRGCTLAGWILFGVGVLALIAVILYYVFVVGVLAASTSYE
ncbi:hypothetical protein CDO52_17330 [Nocardiopsis gilva YIM 90087]|uniref:DUF4190 domain-containing protein n=2 Tax=Nocardiopsis gilva TaxID=280236 RepID=A0A223S878_9ACTN|nr:hypothetical protein CDO52_17330 [Nocardiopsis gilva YIM 90087]